MSLLMLEAHPSMNSSSSSPEHKSCGYPVLHTKQQQFQRNRIRTKRTSLRKGRTERKTTL